MSGNLYNKHRIVSTTEVHKIECAYCKRVTEWRADDLMAWGGYACENDECTHGVPQPKRQGDNSDDEYGETRSEWRVYDRTEVESWMAERGYSLDSHEDVTTLTGWYSCDRGPGQWFWHSPTVRVSRTRILVKHFGGYDI